MYVYRVELNQCECDRLTALLSGGMHAARKLKRAQIVLAGNAGPSNEDIARDVRVGGSTVYRTNSSRALPKFESYGKPETAAFRGRKAQDAIEWFHGIGRLMLTQRLPDCGMCQIDIRVIPDFIGGAEGI
jgi:hypothetical protein